MSEPIHLPLGECDLYAYRDQKVVGVFKKATYASRDGGIWSIAYEMLPGRRAEAYIPADSVDHLSAVHLD